MDEPITKESMRAAILHFKGSHDVKDEVHWNVGRRALDTTKPTNEIKYSQGCLRASKLCSLYQSFQYSRTSAGYSYEIHFITQIVPELSDFWSVIHLKTSTYWEECRNANAPCDYVQMW